MFVVLVVVSDHIGHHFLAYGQFAQGGLGGFYGFIFHPVAEEYQRKNGSSGFVKQVLLRFADQGSV